MMWNLKGDICMFIECTIPPSYLKKIYSLKSNNKQTSYLEEMSRNMSTMSKQYLEKCPLSWSSTAH